MCIEVTPASKVAYISEELCIGCGICVKVSVRADCCAAWHMLLAPKLGTLQVCCGGSLLKAN